MSKNKEPSQETSQTLQDTKSNFLATMSHEMRTPMQSVYGLLELIELEDIAPNVREMTQNAKQSASALLEILDDILDFAKMDADKLELDNFEVPVRTLVRGTLEALSVNVQGKDVALLDDIDEDVPFVVKGDPKRLRQIIVNLCGNALKFTSQGSVTIRVTKDVQHIKMNASHNEFGLRFEVIDSGIGMSDEACKRLFKPFNQADSSTSRKFGGTGLGLSICKKLVTLMGGEIGVFSVEGQGSTFWFEIPTTEVNTDQTTVKLPDLSGLSVLSVEDHPQGAKEIVNSLRSMGAVVDSVATVAEGLKLARARPYDVGVIDQGLPDGAGLDLIRDLMEARPFMGLIMYTVHDGSGLLHSLQSLGVTYLSKPASRAGLGKAVLEASIKTDKFHALGARRLLIAEDTKSVQNLIQRQLKTLGVEADFVDNGAQALEALKSEKYGLLFTDLHMPEMDGYDVVSAIRKKEREGTDRFPVIVLTADVQMAQRQEYLAHGFDECLLKPVTLGHFRRLLMRWGLLEENDQEEKEPSTVKTDGSAAIDLKALEKQLGKIDGAAISMLDMFVEMTAPLIDTLANTDNEAYGDIHDIAHSLKGAARSIGALQLGDMAASAQDMAALKKHDADLIDKIGAAFDDVKKHTKEIKSQIKETKETKEYS